MDKRWRSRITAAFLAVTVLVIAVMLSGTLHRTSHITLPSSEQAPGHAAVTGDALTVVEVTPETVQTAIATLSRPQEYRRTVTVEQLWAGGSGTYETEAAVSGGWTRTDRTLAGGRVRHAITDGETTYIWYDSEINVRVVPAGGISADNEQTIPTYEEILKLPVEAIAAADYREENGAFTSRKQILKVPKLGPKAYEQCAGFLRVPESGTALDNTAVHPESYGAAEKLMEKLGLTMEDVRMLQKEAHVGGKKTAGLSRKIKDEKKLALELGIGELTLQDIVKELEKPARDPREDMPAPILRSDVMDLEDLKPGMILKGTVRNIVDFGAFVDIGVHQDGLVHISQMTDRFIKHPLEAVSVGDIVDVQVLSVEAAKKRIALTMKISGK